MPNTESQTARQQPDGDEEEVPVRHVQTARIRYEPEKERYRLTITQAIRAAGLGKNAVFRFIPEEADTLGVVPALGSENAKNHPRDGRTYSVSGAGETGEALRITIPEAALDALGIDTTPETAIADDLPLLDVYTGDRMIAVGVSNARTVPTDVLPAMFDTSGEGENEATSVSKIEEVVLKPIQTTTPRMRTGDVVTASISTAVKRAGSPIGAVEFLPELTDDLNGFVPAIGHEDGDGRTTDRMRAVHHEGRERQGAVVPLSEDVLSALGLSTTDFEDVPIDDRPALAIFAGDDTRVIGFERVGQREIAVDREQTPGERLPSLTDIAGIGPALAERFPSAGYETVADLADATREDLLAIDGLGEKRANRIMADISNRQRERGEDR